MGCDKNEAVFVDRLEFFFKPAQLPLANTGFVAAIASYIAGVSLAIAFVVNIVEHDKEGVCIFKSVVRRPEKFFKRL